jgi:hypothetical protein
VVFDQKKFNLRQARHLPEVSVNAGDLGRSTEVFVSGNYLCLQAVSMGSGVADRYVSVFVTNPQKHPLLLIKLPPLFGSCTNVRYDQRGGLAFFKAAYIGSEDSPQGVSFSEYSSNGTRFIPTGRSIKAKFTEPDNVFKFELLN